MDWHTLVPYAQAVAPLVVVLVGLPTLEEVAAGELLPPGERRPVFVEPLVFAKHVKQLVLTERNLDMQMWSSLFTHILVHADFRHLAGNIETLVLNGVSAYFELGVLGFYAVFFCCGAASGLNRRGRELQTQAQLEGSIPCLPESIGPLTVPEGAREHWEWLRQRTAQKAAPVLHKRVEAFGASGATSGLMGYGFGAAVLNIFAAVQAPEGARAEIRAGLDSSLTLLNLLQSGRFLFNEWRLAAGDEGLTWIDHSAHLTGFAAGAGLALAARLLRFLSKPRPRPAPSGGRRLGRRGE